MARLGLDDVTPKKKNNRTGAADGTVQGSGFATTDRDTSIEYQTTADGKRYEGRAGARYAPAAPATPTASRGYSSNPAEAQANALYQQLMNRGPFRYDLQGDMLYRQYADQYSQLGRQAMMDTMGTATGLTGGYASSNAQLLGQQANNQYLMQLNAMVPDFYDRAYQAWQDQGDELYNKYQLAMSKVPSRAAAPAATEQTAITPTVAPTVMAALQTPTTVQPTYTVTGLDGIFGNLASILQQDPEFDYFIKYLNAQNGEK